jgi:predicted metal-dependent peptidase
MIDFYKNVIPGSMHEKLTESIIAMMSTGSLPYYGEFALFINFHEAKNNPYIRTAGVNVTSSGMNFYWNREFIDSLSQSASNFLLLHEEFHILFDHVKRSVGYDLRSANIVQDMIINQIIYDEIMIKKNLGTGDNPFISIPQDEFSKNSALFIPKEYEGEQLFEDLYEWYVNKKREWQEKNKEKIKQMVKESNKCSNCGSHIDKNDDGDSEDGGDKDKSDGGDSKKNSKNGQNDGGSGDGDEKDEEGVGNSNNSGTCPICGEKDNNNKSRQNKKDTEGKDIYGKYGKNNVDMYSLETIFEGEEREEQNTIDTHLTDDIPQELKKEIVENIMTKLKNRGLTSGDVETILNKLRKTHKDYLKEIKRTMSNHIFGSKKEKTIVRPNRRGISGLKGKKKYKNEINVILDTSGSMGGEFEKVLSYIFQNDIQINLIQCDAEIQGVIKIKDRKELERMKISGLGGTVLQPGLDFISDTKNKMYCYNIVILTDGYTDSLNFSKIKTKTLILSTASKCPILHDNGRVKQIENIGKQD